MKNSYQLNLNSTYVVHFAYYLRDMPDFISMHGSRARCVLSYSETAVEHLREIFTVSLRSGKYQLENLYNFMNSYNLDRVMGLLDVELESSRFFIENFLYSLKIGNTKRHRGAMKDVIASSDICDIFKVHLVYYKRYADSDRFSHINDLFYMVRFARKKADQCKSRNMFNDLFHMIFISIDLNDIEASMVRCNELFRYEVRQWNNRYDFEFSTDF